jgi:pimeloyl-ACP methyl ester carboxylesterase
MQAGEPRRRSRFWRRRWVRRVFWFVVRVYILLGVMCFFLQDRIIFPRHFAPEPMDDPYGTEAVEITFGLDKGGKAFAWFVPCPGASAEEPAPAVIFFHADYQHDIVEGYHALGCSVLLPEFRGYGRADGRPSEKGILADAERFHDLLVERPDVDAARIVFQGRSLGGGFAAGLAARRVPAALILESTFTSVASMAWGYGLPPFLVKHPLRTDRVLKRLDVPVLIMHGTWDGVVPVSHGRKLSKLARNGRYVEYDCGHMVLIEQPGYWDQIRRLLSESGVIE